MAQDRSDVSVRNPASNPALKSLAQTTPLGVGHGPARHRVRAVQFLWIRHATPSQLLPLLCVEGGARCRASGRDSVMSTRPAAKPVIAIDLAATRKQVREESYVPRSANGREWHFNTAGEALPRRGEGRATATVAEARVDTPTMPIEAVVEAKHEDGRRDLEKQTGQHDRS